MYWHSRTGRLDAMQTETASTVATIKGTTRARSSKQNECLPKCSSKADLPIDKVFD